MDFDNKNTIFILNRYIKLCNIYYRYEREYIMKFIFTLLLIISFASAPAQEKQYTLSVDSLANNIDNFIGKKVTIEGKIIHICPVGGLKMKLKSESGIIVKIESSSAFRKFDTSYKNKNYRITGNVKEIRTDTAFISKTEKNKTILCHIDHTNCRDKEWIEDKKKLGFADSISIKQTLRLRAIMAETKKDFVSTPLYCS